MTIKCKNNWFPIEQLIFTSSNVEEKPCTHICAQITNRSVNCNLSSFLSDLSSSIYSTSLFHPPGLAFSWCSAAIKPQHIRGSPIKCSYVQRIYPLGELIYFSINNYTNDTWTRKLTLHFFVSKSLQKFLINFKVLKDCVY